MKLGINNDIWEVKGIKFEEAITKISKEAFFIGLKNYK